MAGVERTPPTARIAQNPASPQGYEGDTLDPDSIPMTVRALFFASYRDIAGTDQLVLELPAGADVEALVRRLRASEPRWQALPSRPVVAVNMAYASLATPLGEGDEVAFIPPVSGG